MKREYYIGLDCGTNSVGWAVTDPEYNLLRAKGKTMWGSRLFDEAQTAAARRIARGNRRRNDRTNDRLKLLRMLFRDEIVKVDPDFYKRLDESFYRLEDKDKNKLANVSSDTLFNDPDFKDRQYHEEYPTIWHLRKKIIDAEPETHFDIRLYFLAIQHIYKHRGHFLNDGELKGNAGDFNEIYTGFHNAAIEAGFALKENVADRVEEIILDDKENKNKNDKKRLLKELIVDKDNIDNDWGGDYVMLVGMLIGSPVNVRKLFGLESDEEEKKFSFGEGVFENMIIEIENSLGNDKYLEVVLAAKRIYDYAVLKKILKDGDSISDAMVKNYDLHKKDLNEIKELLKPFPKQYTEFFKEECTNVANYNAYIGKAYLGIKNKRKKAFHASQEDVNKRLREIFATCKIDLSKKPDFKERLENNELLPKQRGQAKGIIPQQLHHNELEIIVKKLQKDYPSFAKEVPKENKDYNTKAKKLLLIHSFKRPYYCGPLVTKDKSKFSWAVEEIKQTVYPWNFSEELVHLDARAEKFITNMTNDCTYLGKEKVLPKASLLYQKYMVLNEIDNLKVNKVRINDEKKKQKIYEIFEKGEVSGGLTLRRLEKILKERKIINAQDELSGSAEHKTLPKMSTHQDFKKILGDDYQKRYMNRQLEEVVLAMTIFGDEKAMLKKRIESILKCGKEKTDELARKQYKDWGRFSEKFLTGIKATVDGRQMSILDALEETNNNLMELLSSKYDFAKKLEDYNRIGAPSMDIEYKEVEDLHCSPAVKRSVWQAVGIIKEIKDVMGEAPAKIFLETTRGEEAPKNKGVALARRKRLEENYKSAVKSEQIKELLKELDNYKDQDFQKKKLFLYFQQMGKCAYCGETIDLETLATTGMYDIDHIYPQSLTKDDSLEKNKVLVCAKCNRTKSNIYPIREEIREKMDGQWRVWRKCGLISEEKYNRLTRSTPLTDEELGGFIARQMVETSQTVREIKKMFEEHYPETKVILVKAGQVSDFRRAYGYETKDDNGRVIDKGNPEFIKIREMNDLHHAKDAYLNIVVGNVMSSTFTDDPVKWIKKNHPGEQKNYSINTKVLFRRNEWYFSKKLDKDVNWPVMKEWKYNESFEIISKHMKRNDVLWTRMMHDNSSREGKGQLFDLNIVGKIQGKNVATETQEGLMPIKQNERLAKTAKYGGYNSLNGAYFVLVEQKTKKGMQKKIVQIPIIYKKDPQKYLDKNYPESKIIIDHIPFGVLLKRDGFPMFLTGRSEERLKFDPAMQIFVRPENCLILKRVASVCEKIDRVKGRKIEEEDGICEEQLTDLFVELTGKMQKYFKAMPTTGGRVDELAASKEKFDALAVEEKCKLIMEILKVMRSNALTGDLTKLMPKSENFGSAKFSNNISGNEIEMIKQSITGLMEKRIILNKPEVSEE